MDIQLAYLIYTVIYLVAALNSLGSIQDLSSVCRVPMIQNIDIKYHDNYHTAAEVFT